METVIAALMLVDRALTLGTFAQGIYERLRAARDELAAKHEAGETVTQADIDALMKGVDDDIQAIKDKLAADAAVGPTP